jgi:arabinose-5-phosphate isomerase
LVEIGREVLAIEAAAVLGLGDRLGLAFVAAVRTILDCRGRTVVTGIGKSGHVARKIASTLSSTGTPASFLHPAEGMHGDVGMIVAGDAVIALSYSGESSEILTIVPAIRRCGATLIAMTGNPRSNLAQHADIVLDSAVEREACSLNLAPTASTTAALALGDALAIALLRARGFGSDDFARSHPGGRLGRRLLVRVGDVMRTGAQVPKVDVSSGFEDALVEMTKKGLGMTVVVDGDDRVLGVFTDGDLRRAFRSAADIRHISIVDVMTHDPKVIAADRLAADAVKLMEQHSISQLVVVGEDSTLIGALNMHDLLRAGIV